MLTGQIVFISDNRIEIDIGKSQNQKAYQRDQKQNKRL